MPEKTTNPLGDAGKAVSRNVKRLREQQRLTFVELSERLAALEPPRPIPVLGLRRIEREERRVDVDDLFAFAEVFGVSPISLVLDSDPDADLVAARELLNEAGLMIAAATGGDGFLERLYASGQLTEDQTNMNKTVRSAARAGVYQALQQHAAERRDRLQEGEGQ